MNELNIYTVALKAAIQFSICLHKSFNAPLSANCHIVPSFVYYCLSVVCVSQWRQKKVEGFFPHCGNQISPPFYLKKKSSIQFCLLKLRALTKVCLNSLNLSIYWTEKNVWFSCALPAFLPLRKYLNRTDRIRDKKDTT